MKALKFYDKEGTGFELFADHERQSIMMQVDAEEGEAAQFIEFDDEDIDDIIIAFVELRNEITAVKNISNN